MSLAENFEIIADVVFEKGKQEAQRLFADSYQANGTRQNYTYAYAYNGWNDYTFECSLGYDIAPSAANQMFQYSQVKDIAGIMNRKGVKFDFITNKPSQCFGLFIGSLVEHLPKIVMPTASSAYGLCESCRYLHTIDELVCNEKTTFQSSSGANKSFQACSQFTHCIFSGVIANDINLQWSKLLDAESLVSLAVAAKDFFVGGEPFTKTMTLSEESKAILRNTVYPDPQQYAQDGASCMVVLEERKGWIIA
jgi:hypothetical protein